jgi:hypothetical protein
VLCVCRIIACHPAKDASGVEWMGLEKTGVDILKGYFRLTNPLLVGVMHGGVSIGLISTVFDTYGNVKPREEKQDTPAPAPSQPPAAAQPTAEKPKRTKKKTSKKRKIPKGDPARGNGVFDTFDDDEFGGLDIGSFLFAAMMGGGMPKGQFEMDDDDDADEFIEAFYSRGMP